MTNHIDIDDETGHTTILSLDAELASADLITNNVEATFTSEGFGFGTVFVGVTNPNGFMRVNDTRDVHPEMVTLEIATDVAVRMSREQARWLRDALRVADLD